VINVKGCHDDVMISSLYASSRPTVSV